MSSSLYTNCYILVLEQNLKICWRESLFQDCYFDMLETRGTKGLSRDFSIDEKVLRTVVLLINQMRIIVIAKWCKEPHNLGKIASSLLWFMLDLEDR